MKKVSVVGMAVLAAATAGTIRAQPLGTAFTYQGRLVDGGVPANAIYDLQFTLFDAAAGGATVGPTLTRDDVTVASGLFTVALDFGAGFGGQKRFLEIGIRPGASTGAYTPVSPRQELTPAPNALFAANAATVGGLSCANGEIARWNSGWTCGTDANSGGTITSVVAGNGLTGGASSGAATLNVGGGSGISVVADSISLDTTFTDARYLNVTGDTMSGQLDMNQQRVINRGCPAGHVRIGPGLCTESLDGSGLTFAGCANRCRTQGTHMCSAAEMVAILASGVALGTTTLLDWVDDMNGVGAAMFVTSVASPETALGSRATSTSSFCRCCANVE